jgi:hypothetical protein
LAVEEVESTAYIIATSSSRTTMPGETGPISVSLAKSMVIAGFFAVAVYNTFEILICLFSIFRKRRSLYFWSLLVATLGILIHSIAVLLRFYKLAPNFLMCVFVVLGWWAMVTGQSVVLYSRLGLVVSDVWKMRFAAIMIITNFFVLHIPVSILFLATNSGNPDPYLRAFDVYEKIQLAGFSVQECILSGIYLWEATTTLKPIMAIKGAEGRRMIRHLIILFIATALLDSSLMATEYTNHFHIQTTLKPVVYSVKLKMEFVVLNELLVFTHACRDNDRFINAQAGRNESQSCAGGEASVEGGDGPRRTLSIIRPSWVAIKLRGIHPARTNSAEPGSQADVRGRGCPAPSQEDNIYSRKHGS